MLSEPLRCQLFTIQPSHDWDTHYYPCEVTLFDGSIIDRVYVAPEGTWGLKKEGNKPFHICVDDVQSIRESPNRLPITLANKLYAGGESGMGYTFFGIKLHNMKIIPCCAGNAYDFIQLPEGISLSDIEDVIPHWGRDIWRISTMRAEGASFKWCLY
jgi:hypothetical protein